MTGPAVTESSPPGDRDRDRDHDRSGDCPAGDGGVGLLDALPADVRRLVAAAFEPVEFEFGEVLVREGEPADAVWLLRSGRARVVRQGAEGEEVLLNRIGPGAVFGELAVLRNTPRTATVRASTPGTAARLPAAVLRALVAAEPAAADALEDAARRYEITDLLRLASPLARMSGEALSDVVGRLRPVDVAAGVALLTAGEVADALYLVESGRLVVDVEIPDPGAGRAPTTRTVGWIRAGDVVGERGLVTGTPRDATVTAVEDCRLQRLDAADLDAVVAGHPGLRDALAELAASYDHQRLAAVPLDFAVLDEPGTPAAPTEATTPTTAPAETGAAEERGLSPKSGRRRGPHLRRSRRIRLVRQIDEADCGVAALRMASLAYGKRVPHHQLRTMVGTEADGTSAAGLARAAEGLGFDTRVLKVSKTALDDLPTPAILHLDGNHWVVLTGTRPSAVDIADPAYGHRRLSRAELLERWTGFTIQLAPGADFQPGGRRLPTYDWIGPLVRPHRRRLVTVAVLAVVLSACELSLEVVTQVVVDQVVRHGRHASVAPAFAVLIAVVAVLAVGTLIQRLSLLSAAQAMDRDSLDLLSRRLLGLPLAYFSSRRAGDLQRRMDGLRAARSLIVDAGALAIALTAQLLASVALLFYYSWPIATLFCVAMPAYAAVAAVTLSRLRPAAAAVEEESGRYASRQVEIVKGIETVKVLAAEDELQQGLVDHQTRMVARQVRADRLRAAYAAATQGLGFAVLAAFLALGVHEVQEGSLSIGALVACVTLVALATAPVQSLVSLADGLQHAVVLLDRVEDVFAAEPEVGEKAPLLAVPSLSGRLTLDALGYSYGETRVLHAVSVEIPAGTAVAVVGRSGSGKTTLVRCLSGLLVPTDGTLRFDGVDAARLDRRQLRRQIGVVPQEPYLFSDTISANIALGADLDPSRVERAARLAHAHDFIARLPLGYDTPVGESGLALSGGQRQRLAIARALYREPPILVLDEATSALDAESERAVQEGLSTAMAGRTSITVAHRLSTVRHADLILVLDAGRLVERGTHDELVARRGLYFFLASQQLGL